MLKCLAVICILGLVSAAEWENGQAGKRSQRLNLLSRTVGARMLAGTNGQMDPNFQTITPTGANTQQQFVPIARTNTAGINSITPTGNQFTDNSLTGGQQLTPDQIQQLHSFLTAQQQSQQQPVSQFGQQQPTGQQPTTGQQVPPVGRTMTNTMPQQQQPQQMQPTQQFRMDSTGVTGGMNKPTDSFVDQQQQQTMNGQFGQGRMMMPTQQQQQPTPGQTNPVEPMGASKPSALEQQLLDQQVLTQKLKEQLQQLQQQQQQKIQSPVPTKSFGQQPVEQQQQMFGNQQQVAQDQLTQEQKMQRMTSQQQQQQQQQLLDQINQLNQLTQQQGRTVGQQQPTTGLQQPTQNFGVKTNQMMPTMPTQPMMPTNTSRMVMGGQQQQQRPAGVASPVFKQGGRIGGGDICASAKPGELLPHPLDETQFLVCNELGEITLMDCPNHTVFNPHLKLCDLTSEMPLLCKANPCLNGAKCVEVTPVQFRCECPQGFSGKTCEKFDTCQSSRPCGSDGVCLSFALGSPIPHVCLCNGGRSVGLTCDKQIEQNPCTLSGSSTKLMPVAFNRAVFAHCEGARPHFKFCQPPLMFSASKQACEWSI